MALNWYERADLLSVTDALLAIVVEFQAFTPHIRISIPTL